MDVRIEVKKRGRGGNKHEQRDGRNETRPHYLFLWREDAECSTANQEESATNQQQEVRPFRNDRRICGGAGHTNCRRDCPREEQRIALPESHARELILGAGGFGHFLAFFDFEGDAVTLELAVERGTADAEQFPGERLVATGLFVNAQDGLVFEMFEVA